MFPTELPGIAARIFYHWGRQLKSQQNEGILWQYWWAKGGAATVVFGPAGSCIPTLRPTNIFLSVIWLFNLLVVNSIICYKRSDDDFRPFWVFLVNFTLLCNEFKIATKCHSIIVISLAERLELWVLELFTHFWTVV